MNIKNISIQALIIKIEELDPEAAQYVRNTSMSIHGEVTLAALFIWEATPQGDNFWRRIDAAIDYSTTTILSPEQKHLRVQRRIKELWNNSNWVKANPSQAY